MRDKKKGKLNGSVDILAEAMKNVFQEGMDATREGIKEDMDAMEGRLKEDTAQQIAKQETRFNTSLGKLQRALLDKQPAKKSGRGTKPARP